MESVNVSRTRHRRGLRIVHREHDEARRPALDDERLALMAALRRLPTAQREAIALFYLADLPIHEVAAATGTTVGTVKSRLSRGRKALAVLLADLPDSHEEAPRG